LSPAIAIDLGTSNTLIHVAGRGVVVDQPSLVAIRGSGERQALIAVGRDALAIDGRQGPDVRVVRPVHDGVVADLDACVAMLQAMLRQLPYRLPRARVLVSVPHGVTAVERAAFHDAARRATGARRVELVAEPMAAAIGVGLPVRIARGHLVLDVGSGITEAAVTSLGEIVACASVRAGGATLDARIAGHLRVAHGLEIGARSAEHLKRALVGDRARPGTTAIAKGRHTASGLPAAREVGTDELHAAIAPTVEALVAPVLAVLETLSPELVADIASSGIWITGGGSLVPVVARAVERRVGVRIRPAPHPLGAVIRGNAAILARA
jgi:rod shape-determining protein MreB